MQTYIIAVFISLGSLFIGFIVTFQILKNKSSHVLNKLQEKYETSNKEIERLRMQDAILTQKVIVSEQISKRYDELSQNYLKSTNKIVFLEATLDKEIQLRDEKLKLLQENKQQMKLEFQDLANQILESNSKKFSIQNQDNLIKMITPIKEQFNEFKKQIDDVYIKEAKDRSMLQAEVKAIKEINHQMSQDAKNLTRALKGESKKQGIWGEMILESVLENSGLREGFEYEREVSLIHDDNGAKFRPDVIVYLPDSREIIIDAKTSLTAYERYVNGIDDEQRVKFANLHVVSLKKHIDELSKKDYTKLKGIKSLDFVFMFVPIESALLMAMEEDVGLFDYAFKKRVILVGPTTLMVSLRAIENTWRYEHQQKNAQEIAKRAGFLFDKFVGFVESFEKLGKNISTMEKTYDEVYKKLHTGAGSITTQFQKLEKLGASASKDIPKHITRQIEEENN